MASYKDELEVSLLGFPTIFHIEDDVLHHLFFVLGNGFDWVDGELTEHKSLKGRLSKKARLKKIWDDERRTGHYKDFYGIDIPKNFYPKSTDDPILNYIIGFSKGFDKYRSPIDNPSNQKPKLYPLCEYSKICTIPENIKPDWLEAASKAYLMAISGNYELTEQDKKYLVQVKETLNKRKVNVK